MADRQNSGTPVSPGIIARVTQGVKYMITGVKPDTWFGPLQPLQPVAQEVAGRQFDYPVASNIDYMPAQKEKRIGFNELRLLADNYDLMRLAIETRKDQVSRLRWKIKPKDPHDKNQQDDIDTLTAFFESPDKINDWSTWIRAIIEDVLVIDAPCLYPRFTVGKQLDSIEIMDGATIKVLISDDGRMPIPPSPAYQQVLHGVPAVDYTRDELIYAPRNVRSHKLYGFSPVEQVITTINIALRRQVSQLEYYTSGSVPDALAAVPETWNPDQIAKFQAYWDGLNSGNLAERRKLKFIPGGIKYTQTKESPLKDDYDEWLSKIVSYAFSISPQALQKQMNRASAETSQEASENEGLAPLQEWIATLINKIIVKYFGKTEIIFGWEEEVENDGLKQAQINDIYVRNGTKSVDEVRAELGLLPIGFKNAVYTGTGVTLVSDVVSPPEVQPNPMQPNAKPPKQSNSEQSTADQANELDENSDEEQPTGNKMKPVENKAAKIEKAKKKSVLEPIDRDRRKVVITINKLRAYFATFFKKEAKRIAQQVIQHLGKSDEEDEAARIVALINMNGWTVTIGDVEEILAAMGKDGARMAWLQLGGIPDDESLVTTADDVTVDYAKQRAAELIGMKYNAAGDLVENPNPVYAITDTTRDSLQTLITQAMQEGWSNDHLASQIEDNYAFSESRADTIARTETKRADMQGSMSAYRASGVVHGKQSVMSDDHDHDDECDDNEDDGVIPLDDNFSSGDDAPPYHPNCNCTLVPADIEGFDEGDEEEESEDEGD